ncbi:MAG: hypothetical protein HOG66_10240 [Flavobacteriales bacterium]|nr:hypothetical protein [Flavobacteriales bacterium]
MRTLLILSALLVNLCGKGQSVLTNKGLCQGESFSYAKRGTDSLATHVIVGLLDSKSSSWNSITWCSMIAQITQQPEAIILVPEPDVKEDHLVCLVTKDRDSIPSERVQFVSLGGGALMASKLVNEGFSGMFISPQLIPVSIGAPHEAAFALCETSDDSTVGFLVDSLSRDSHWAMKWDKPSQDIFYIDNYKSEYQLMYNWVDSLQSLLLDTMRSAPTSSATTNLPEVIRQGTVIEIEVFMALQGSFSCKIQSLSAEEVFSKEVFLGKGKHTLSVVTTEVEWGVYTLVLEFDGSIEKHKFMIRG